MDQPTGVLFDIDGVLVVSWKALDGAAEAVQRVREAGIGVRFVTNTTSRTAAGIAEALRGAGLVLDDAELVSAGVATAEMLRTRFAGSQVLLLNDGPFEESGGLHFVEGTAAERADVVVVGGAGASFDWSNINTALRALLNGARLVGMHGAMMWQTDAGACVDGGSYLSMLAAASGVEPLVVGKPAPVLFETACASMSVDPTSAVMVGDDLESDVLAAQRLGLAGVLVRTGKFRSDALDASPGRPDHVIDSVADLPTLLGLA